MNNLEKYMNDVLGMDERFKMKACNEKTLNNLMFYALALAGEAGELANIVKKMARDKIAGNIDPELWKAFDEELVDILIYMVKLIHLGDVEFDKAWDEKQKVLHKRWENREVKDYAIEDQELGGRDV